MGNDLSGHAPTQILPIDTCVTELCALVKGLELVECLGNTRFLKVVHCKTENGPTVVKVFITEGSGVFSNLATQASQEINDAKARLSLVSNCLPINKTHQTDKAGFFLRPYIKCSLYDRLSMRPYLSSIEKKWIAFQILKGLKKCHSQAICHGDLKMENILITSWAWVLISDFAFYKPVHLPVNNPSDFSFFFDSSKKTVCSIAPERFKGTKEAKEEKLKFLKPKLTPEMDIFSAGCVLTELFTEGSHPFNLNGLLRFRNGDYYPDSILETIEDSGIRDLIKSMISLNPEERKSASDYLTQEQGKSFPLYFYTTLYPFAEQMRSDSRCTSDEKILLLQAKYDDLLSGLGINVDMTSETSEDVTGTEGLVIIANMLTSFSKKLESSEAKFICVKLLKKLCKHLPDQIIMDRIVPCILHIIDRELPTVQAHSLYVLTDCLKCIREVSRQNVNVFSDFIFPSLAKIPNFSDTIVRMAYAETIAELAEIAQRYLMDCNKKGWCGDYEKEKSTLQKLVTEQVSYLFADSSTNVKRRMVESSIERLCTNFDENLASDSLLSHLVTYLNEKQDHYLRRTFFRSLKVLAEKINISMPEVLEPLLVQGLSDTDELVVLEAIRAMKIYSKSLVFSMNYIKAIIGHVAPMLIHPNYWIRSSAVGLISLLAGNLERLYVDAIVLPILKPYLTKDICLVSDEGVLCDALKPPIPRDVYDSLAKSKHLLQILTFLEHSVNNVQSKIDFFEGIQDAHTISTLRLLMGSDLSDDMKRNILHMRHLMRLNTMKLRGDSKEETLIRKPIETDSVPLFTSEESLQITSLPLSKMNTLASSTASMNNEWKEMFGAPSSPFVATKEIPVAQVPTTVVKPSTKLILASGKNIGYTNRKYLERAVQSRRDHYIMNMRRKTAENRAKLCDAPLNMTRWTPLGDLVAHLHEHRAFINRLVHLKGSSIYASCSNDGTVKIWDTGKIGRKYPMNKSIGTYTKQGGRIVSLTSCSENNYLASGSDSGSIHVFKWERFSDHSSWTVEDDYATDMHFMETGQSPVLLYSTVKSGVIGLDLRKPGIAFKLQNDRDMGPISSFVLDYSHNFLTLSTLYGNILTWDLRFHLLMSKIECEKEDCAVRRISLLPGHPSTVVCSMNKNHKLCFFDLASGSCYKTITARSNSRQAHSSDYSFTGFHMGSTVGGQSFVVTGGDDCKLRFWDLDEVPHSTCISEGFTYSDQNESYSYYHEMKGDMEVIQERRRPKRTSISEPTITPLMNNVPTGHSNIISDVLVVENDPPLIVASGMDGVIKMWK